MKDVFMITKYKGKDGDEKVNWSEVGVVFGDNKDGSANVKLHMFPDVTFQIRERKLNKGSVKKEKESAANS